MFDAESMLLIDDHQRKIVEDGSLREERMRADQELDVSGGDPCQEIPFLPRGR